MGVLDRLGGIFTGLSELPEAAIAWPTIAAAAPARPIAIRRVTAPEPLLDVMSSSCNVFCRAVAKRFL
jgi:hypothetical protein